MSDMKEIEKAIDEFDWAVFWVTEGVNNKRSVDDINRRLEHKAEKRAHLLELIKEVKHE